MGRHILPPSADDWQVGDIAECVNIHGWFHSGRDETAGPVFGELYRVTGVVLGACGCIACKRRPFIALSNFGPTFFDAAGFRKVQPRADTSGAAEADFLNTWLPTQEAA